MKNKRFKKVFLGIGVLQLVLSGTLQAQTPSIASFSPIAAAPQSTITITGTNFNPVAANNIVYFGAVTATVAAASATQLEVTVPYGATCKPITVLNTATGLSASSQNPFVSTFSPTGQDFTSLSFHNAVAYGQPVLFRGIAVADFDGDGKVDVAGLSTSGTPSVGVLRNTSTGSGISFAARLDLPLGGTSRLLSTGDIDNDGKIDIIVGATSSAVKTLYIFRNTSNSGSLSFAPRTDIPADNGLASIAVGDLDGDGKPELVASNSAGGVLSVYKNVSTPGSLSAGSFTKTNFPANPAGGGVAIGDIDGDGKPDITVADQNNTKLSVFRNTVVTATIDAGSFAPKVDFDLGASGLHYAVLLGDLDRDGKLDVVVPKGGANAVAVFRNTSTAGTITASSLAARVELPLPANSFGGELSDLDGDGKIDIVALASSKVVAFRNKATSGSLTVGSFDSGVEYAADAGSGSSPNFMTIGDMNADGRPDLIPSLPTSGYTFSVLTNAMSSTLPLRFLSVVASQKESRMQVEWLTADETQVARFEIERSENGRQFVTLGNTVAKGKGAGTQRYQFLDAAPLKGTSYYRIRAIGTAGDVNFSRVVKVQNKTSAIELSVYPNPVKEGQLGLHWRGGEKGNYQVSLYNSAGQVVLTKEIAYSGGSVRQIIPLEKGLPAGVYHVMINGAGTTLVQQIVKE